jgi:hypothetical protein
MMCRSLGIQAALDEAIEFKFLRSALHLCPPFILFDPCLSTNLLTFFAPDSRLGSGVSHLTLMKPLNSVPPVIHIDLVSLNNPAVILMSAVSPE